MRHLTNTLLLLLTFVLLAACAPGDALAAAAQAGGKKNKQTTARQSGQSKNTQSSALAKAEADFRALCDDGKRGALRENWVRLETRFRELAAKGKGETAARAALFVGRTREELGKRSFSASDHRLAAREYADAASRFSKSKVAPAALLGQAGLLVYKLGDREKGRTVLEGLLKKYPKAEEAQEARNMLASLSGQTGRAARSRQGPGKAGTASSGKGAPAKKGDILEQLGLTIQTIMLDAGHGGKDPGCMAGGLTERDFTLNMTKRVGALLQKKGFTVLYTRTGNKSLNLQDRPDMANNKKADLFISIHLNANKDPKVRGLETYYLDEAKTSDAVTVAARENAVSVKNISDLQFILTDLMLSSKVEESHELATCVQKGILNSLRRSRVEVHDNGIRGGPFYVLMGARMPAILVEFGYATNESDARYLKSEAYLQRQAKGLVDGIVAYKAKLAQVSRR